ncbi:MAG: peptidoglycan bridge formation glycyltransferase FemA/FemB family protein [Patescibacteria group bacterium]|nr:peptidoglycan bridge formation glycyltransferase FemA/FemB family protein [Patescibacteria group bacterium]
MLEVKEIKVKKLWDEFLSKKEIDFPFFQTWSWGEVQKKLGFNILRRGLFEEKKIVGICLIVEKKARRGHFLHLRHGPVFLDFKPEYFDFIIENAKNLAKEKGTSFVRISPLIQKDKIEESFFKKRGFIDYPIPNMDAEVCWVLDIQKPEDEILKSMRKTHRYLIRKALQMDIEIVRTNKMSEINKFLKLYNELSKAKHFIPHKGIKEEFEEFGKDDEALLFFAKYEGKILATALIVFAGDMAIYHHGASSSEFKNIPASYLLQWSVIQEAKKRGKKYYNFWGIADSPNHPWHGHTLFKTGFGGEKVQFVQAKDLPLSPIYWKTYLIELITKWRKGY